MQHALQQTQAAVAAERQQQQHLLQEHAALASMAQYQQAALQVLQQAGQAEALCGGFLPWQQHHQHHQQQHQQQQQQQQQLGQLPPLLPSCATAPASVPLAEAALAAAAAAAASVPHKASGDHFCSEGLQGFCCTHGAGPGGSGGGSSSAVTPGVFGALAVYARGERSFVNLILQDAGPCAGAPVGHTWASLRSW
jgi:hypothetical protein